MDPDIGGVGVDERDAQGIGQPQALPDRELVPGAARVPDGRVDLGHGDLDPG
ncbi:MAG: hypothetical protein M0C28_07405 [Candidatus Moduliflexus flocculans]|nr:hypothetical protein [Candidatus Moduliflexus flocculans]